MNKILNISFCLLLLGMLCQCKTQQPASWYRFKRAYASNGATFRLNGLNRMLLGMAGSLSSDSDAHRMLHLLAHLKGMEVRVAELRPGELNQQDVLHLDHQLHRSGYDPLMNLRDGKDLIYIWSRTGTADLDHPLALVYSGSDLVLVEGRGKMALSTLADLAQAWKQGEYRCPVSE